MIKGESFGVAPWHERSVQGSYAQHAPVWLYICYFSLDRGGCCYIKLQGLQAAHWSQKRAGLGASQGERSKEGEQSASQISEMQLSLNSRRWLSDQVSSTLQLRMQQVINFESREGFGRSLVGSGYARLTGRSAREERPRICKSRLPK